MAVKVPCPVCRVTFVHSAALQVGEEVLCPVCGARLEVTDVSAGSVEVRRLPAAPDKEIRDRIAAFARLRGFKFNEDRESVVEGLLGKHEKYGDFFCPCKFDNTPENICPCLETRSGYVLKEGHCY